MANIAGMWSMAKLMANGVQVSQPENTAYGAALYNSRMRTIRSDEANMFAPVNALVQEAVNRDIYPLDQYGQRIPLQLAPTMWQVLQNPNGDYSFTKFLNTAMAAYIANHEVRILFWHTTGGDPEPGYTSLNSIAGITFLQRGSRYNVMDAVKYNVRGLNGDMHIVGRESVATLRYSIDADTMTPVSPGSASHEVAQIVDAMNMQLQAYFDNDATPSLRVIIHAKTTAEYDQIRRTYEQGNRGAAHSYGTVYQHVVDDGVLGNGNPRIEIIPVGANSNNLDVSSITAYAQGIINANLGVSPLIYGDTDATSYQNQEVVNDKFNRRVINTLRQFLSDLAFELNRITGGIGFTFGFDYQETEFAEKKLTQSQTTVQNATAFQTLINLGVNSDMAALAVGRNDWLGLNAVKAEQPSTAPIVNVKPAAPMANAIAPTQPEIAKPKTGVTATVKDRQPKQHDRITQILADMAVAHIKRGKRNAVDDEDVKYLNALLAELQQIADNGGTTAARQLAQQIRGLKVGTSYEISGQPLQDLQKRAETVIDNYGDYLDDEMAKASQSTLDPETGEMVEPSDPQSSLLDSVTAGAIASRIGSIVTSEGKNAFQTGQLDNAQQISETPGVTITKIWRATGSDPCEFCQAMDGVEAGIYESFAPDGIITGTDGGTLALDPEYDDGELPDGHVNCVAADTVVNADDVKSAQYFNYSGQVVKLRMASGRFLTVTPNHILLTDRGWVRAKFLKQSDKIVGYAPGMETVVSSANPAHHDVKASIEQVVSSFGPRGKVLAASVPATAEDFKGDGIPNQKINIVFAKSLLRNIGNPFAVQRLSDLPFVGTGDFAVPLDGFRSLTEALIGLLASTDSGMGVLGEGESLFSGELAHSDAVSVALMSNYHARINKSESDDASCDVQGLRDFLLGHPAFVAFDDIRDIEVVFVHDAPFYDLHSTSTLYVANGLMSSNCQCTWQWKVTQDDAESDSGDYGE